MRYWIEQIDERGNPPVEHLFSSHRQPQRYCTDKSERNTEQCPYCTNNQVIKHGTIDKFVDNTPSHAPGLRQSHGIKNHGRELPQQYQDTCRYADVTFFAHDTLLQEFYVIQCIVEKTSRFDGSGNCRHQGYRAGTARWPAVH